MTRNRLQISAPAAVAIAATMATAAAALALLPGAAAAQSPLMPKFSLGEGKRKLSPEEQAKQDALDRDYNAATKKIPDQKPNDPWASVRPAPPTPTVKKKAASTTPSQ